MENLKIDESIEKEARANNKLGLRLAILNNIAVDGDREKYNEILSYLEKEDLDIFEEDDGSDLNFNKGEWTLDYFASIRNDLNFNFSKKKLDHFNDIAVYRRNKRENIKEDDYSKSPTIDDSRSVYVDDGGSDNKAIYRLLLLAAIGVGAVFIIFKIIKRIAE